MPGACHAVRKVAHACGAAVNAVLGERRQHRVAVLLGVETSERFSVCCLDRPLNVLAMPRLGPTAPPQLGKGMQLSQDGDTGGTSMSPWDTNGLFVPSCRGLSPT